MQNTTLSMLTAVSSFGCLMIEMLQVLVRMTCITSILLY